MASVTCTAEFEDVEQEGCCLPFAAALVGPCDLCGEPEGLPALGDGPGLPARHDGASMGIAGQVCDRCFWELRGEAAGRGDLGFLAADPAPRGRDRIRARPAAVPAFSFGDDPDGGRAA